MKIVLDAGPGGDQPGCVINGATEKDITMSIVLLLQEKLESEGAAVVLTRSTLLRTQADLRRVRHPGRFSLLREWTVLLG